MKQNIKGMDVLCVLKDIICIEAYEVILDVSKIFERWYEFIFLCLTPWKNEKTVLDQPKNHFF